MKIKLNDREKQVRPAATVAEIVDVCGCAGNVAVAVNGVMVARDKWVSTELHEGDDVLVIAAAYGG